MLASLNILVKSRCVLKSSNDAISLWNYEMQAAWQGAERKIAFKMHSQLFTLEVYLSFDEAISLQ